MIFFATGPTLPSTASRTASNGAFPSELTASPFSDRRLETRTWVFQKSFSKTVTGCSSSTVRRAIRPQNPQSVNFAPHEQRYVERSTRAVSPVAAPIEAHAGWLPRSIPRSVEPVYGLPGMHTYGIGVSIAGSSGRS